MVERLNIKRKRLHSLSYRIGSCPILLYHYFSLVYVVRHARKKITITVGKIRRFEEFLCEGDERPLEEQRADLIVAEGFES